MEGTQITEQATDSLESKDSHVLASSIVTHTNSALTGPLRAESQTPMKVSQMLITVSDTVATAMHQIAQRESCPCEISILARKECIGE